MAFADPFLLVLISTLLGGTLMAYGIAPKGGWFAYRSFAEPLLGVWGLHLKIGGVGIEITSRGLSAWAPFFGDAFCCKVWAVPAGLAGFYVGSPSPGTKVPPNWDGVQWTFNLSWRLVARFGRIEA
jgi:hypothetical protein